ADVGRAMAADIDPRYPGAELWASNQLGMYSAQGEKISQAAPSINFGVWWDGDLLRELLDDIHIDKWDWEKGRPVRLLTAQGAASNNGTKATPSLSGDILGDWREEVIWRTADSSALRIYTATEPTEHRIYTLMHDPMYRVAIAWQNVAYNQPPHPSFFIGEGMATPAAPDLYFVGNNPNAGPVAGSSSSQATSSSSNNSSSSSSASPQVTLEGTAGNGQVELNWTVNGNITGIEIYRDTDANPAGRTRIASLSANTRS